MKRMENKDTFQHGEVGSHIACNTRRGKEGLRTIQCCICEPHKGCDFTGDEVVKWRKDTITSDPIVDAAVKDKTKEKDLETTKPK